MCVLCTYYVSMTSLHYYLCIFIKVKTTTNNNICPSNTPYYLNICILICILMLSTLHGVINMHILRRDLAGGEGFDVPNEVR